MSNTNEETREIRAAIALELLRFLMLREIGESGSKYSSIMIEKLNEVLLVGGQPLVVPGEVEAPELKIIKVDQEDEA